MKKTKRVEENYSLSDRITMLTERVREMEETELTPDTSAWFQLQDVILRMTALEKYIYPDNEKEPNDAGEPNGECEDLATVIAERDKAIDEIDDVYVEMSKLDCEIDKLKAQVEDLHENIGHGDAREDVQCDWIGTYEEQIDKLRAELSEMRTTAEKYIHQINCANTRKPPNRHLYKDLTEAMDLLRKLALRWWDEGTKHESYSSRGNSTGADLLRFLAKHGIMKIVYENGDRVSTEPVEVK